MTGVRIAVGERLDCDDGALEVTAVDGAEVTVKYLEDGACVSMALGQLVGLGGLRPLGAERPDPAEAPRAVFADGVPEDARARALSRLAEIQEAVTGYRSGDPARALAGEPREEYDPALVPQLIARLEAKATELTARGGQVSARTLRRQRDAYASKGIMALLDGRYGQLRPPLANCSSEFLGALDDVMDRYVDLSTVSRSVIRREVRRLLRASHPDRPLVALEALASRKAENPIVWPSNRWFYELLKIRARGRGAFGAAKGRRSVARRPGPSVALMRARRSGEIVQLDSTRVDVLCVDPVAGALVRPEITVAVDAYDRCVRAVRVVGKSARGVDAALLLYDIVTPEPMRESWPAHARWLYGGIPEVIVSDAFENHLRGAAPSGKPIGAPGTVVIDHGRIYTSEVFKRACEEFGVSIQPAPPGAPTYKAVVERFFDTANQRLWQHLPGYVGRSVHERGSAAEAQAILTIDELRELLVDWIVCVYHHTVHDGCRPVAMPHVTTTPVRMFEESIARGGFLVAPPHPESLQRILPFEWRSIQHYGVDFKNLRYSAEVLSGWAQRASGYRDRPKQHPIHYDPRDLSRVWFRDPDDGTWHALTRVGADEQTVHVPFNASALAFAKRLLVEHGHEYRGWDATNDALDELLSRHLREEGRTAAERRLLSSMVEDAQQADSDSPPAHEAVLDGLESQEEPPRPEPASPLPVADGPNDGEELGEEDGWGDIVPLERLR